MKKLNKIIILVILATLLFSSIVYALGVIIENAINEKHEVSLVSDVYQIDIVGGSNESSSILKGINDITFEITKIVDSYENGTLDFDYVILAMPNDDTLENGKVIERITKSIYSNVDSYTITNSDSIFSKSCYLAVVPYTEYNAYITSFEDLKMLNNEYRHQVVNNDSAITDLSYVSYESLTDVYSSSVFKEIYILNDFTIPHLYTINTPCSIHLLTNDITLNDNLRLENYYSGTYIIDSISGNIVNNSNTFTINTPNASNYYIGINQDSYVIDNTSINSNIALNFAEGFFTNDIYSSSVYYTVLFDNIILPRKFYHEDIILKYYYNYDTTKEEFVVTRGETNSISTVTIEVTNSSGTILGTQEVNVWIVGTNVNNINMTFAKVLELQVQNGLTENTNDVYINITTEPLLNNFLIETSKVISLSGTDYENNYVLTCDGISLELTTSTLNSITCTYLHVSRDTFNGSGYIYINGNNEIYALVDLLTLDFNTIKIRISEEIGQVFFSSDPNIGTQYEITAETAFENQYHLNDVEYELVQRMGENEIATESIIYDDVHLRVVNVNAVYNLINKYYLKINIRQTAESEVVSIYKDIIVPASTTGSSGENSIISNLFTANFDAMSNFIGKSNDFFSNFAKFYMKINNQNVSNYIAIYNEDGTILDNTDEINDRRFYFRTNSVNIPETDTTIYVNVYVTDKDTYANGQALVNAYDSLLDYNLSNGVFTSNGVPITTIYNNNQTIYITYDGNSVTNISSSDGTVTYSSPNVNLTSFSYDIGDQTTVVFYNQEGSSISVFLQEYSFIIPGIYQESIFGSNLYNLLMDQYGYFEEMLPLDDINLKDHYLLTSTIAQEHDLFTNQINLTYINDGVTVTNIAPVNGESNITLSNYFYYKGNTISSEFYNNLGERIDENILYNLNNGLYDDENNPITIIYNDLSSNANNLLSSLYYLNNTKEINIQNVTQISQGHLSSWINHDNTNLETLVLSNCGIDDAGSTLNFSKLSALTNVDLSHNSIKNIPTFSMRINDLDLSNNDITDITNIEFVYSLVNFDISYNKVSVFLPLTQLNNLQTVDVSSNTPDTITVVTVSPLTISAYGTNGLINVPTFTTLRSMGVEITGVDTSTALINEACYVVSAIAPLNQYKSSFNLDLSTLIAGYDLNNESHISITINIYLAGASLPNSLGVYTSLVIGQNQKAIIELTYTDSVLGSVTVYREIYFSVIS